MPVLTGQSTFAKMLSSAAGNVTTLCHIMNTAGCCAQSFFDITNSLLTMTCHALTAQTLGDMVTQCPSPLPPACPKTQVPNFSPPTGCPIASGITIPAAADDCGIPPGMCPQNACQWICAVVTDDPPALVPGTLPAVPATSPGSADASLESCAADVVASDDMVGPQCAAAGPQLRQLTAMLALSPQLFTEADQEVLTLLCTPGQVGPGSSSCVSQLAGQFGAYADALLNTTATSSEAVSDACSATLAPNLAPLSSVLGAAMCVSAKGDAPGSCAYKVASALQPFGVMDALFGTGSADAAAAVTQAAPAVCEALRPTGCCGLSFIESAFAAAQMTCRFDVAQALTALAASCDPPLAPPCEGFAVPSYDAPAANCTAVQWPAQGCPVPLTGQTCPATACQLACAAVRPAQGASSAAWSSGAPSQGEPVAAAAYVTACLEDAAGAPFTPGCSATYGDAQALVSLVVNAPTAFGTADTAVLEQLCSPQDGNYPCVSQLAAMAGAFFTQVGSPQGGDLSTCDTHLAPNIEPLASMGLQFACLNSNTHAATWCLPAAAQALGAGNLSALLRLSDATDVGASVTAAQINASAPAVCASLVASSAGCCGASMFTGLSAAYSALCRDDLATAITALAATCAAPPYQLTSAVCPSFTPAAIKAPPKGCTLGVDLHPTTCNIAPGTCPASACQLLCAVGANDPPAGSPTLVASLQASSGSSSKWVLPPMPAGSDGTAAWPDGTDVSGASATTSASSPPPPPPQVEVTAPSSNASTVSTWSLALNWDDSPPAPSDSSEYDSASNERPDNDSDSSSSADTQAAGATSLSEPPPPPSHWTSESDYGGLLMAATNITTTAAKNPNAAAQYLTRCVNAAPKGKPLSAKCTAGYQHLEQLLGTLAKSPGNFSDGDASQLASMCASSPASSPGKVIPSCVAQYANSFGAYMEGLPATALGADLATYQSDVLPPPAPGAPPGSGAASCSADMYPWLGQELARVAGALACTTQDGIAENDDSTAGGAPLCLPIVANALAAVDMWGMGAFANPGALDPKAFCAALSASGCCGAAAANAALNVLGASCMPQTKALATLVAQCKLPPACPSYSPPDGLLTSPVQPAPHCKPLSLPASGECAGVQKQEACPSTPCQFLCAVVTLDPPQRQQTVGPVQQAAAAAAQQRLARTAGATCDAMAVAVAMALGVTLLVCRRRAPHVAVQGAPPNPWVAAAASAARGVALAAAVVGAGANACMLPAAHLCTPTGLLSLSLPLRAAGVVLAYVGLGCFVSAASVMATADANTLVRTGPYALCRHPQLACSAAIGVGIVLATRSGLALPGVAALWLMGAASALVEEERHLGLAFGAKWDAYVATTPAVVPRLLGPAPPQPGSPAMHSVSPGGANQPFSGPARLML